MVRPFHIPALATAALIACGGASSPPVAPAPPPTPMEASQEPASAPAPTPTPPSSPPAAPPPAATTDEAFCVAESNRYRALANKAPLTHDPALDAYAATGARADTKSGRAHGHFVSTRGGGIAFAENQCPAFGGWTLDFGDGTLRGTIAACLKAFYDEGPGGGHYDNLMGDYRTVGCGWYLQPNGQITITQDLGH